MWRNLVLASRVVAGATLPSHRHCSSKIIRRISQQSAAPPVAPPPSRVTHKDPYLRIAPATFIPRHGSSAVHRYFASSSSSRISTDDSNSTSFSFRPDEGHRIAGLPDQIKLLEKQDAASLSPAEQNLLQALRHHHQPRSGEAAIPDSTQNKTDIPEDVLALYSRLRDCYVALEYWDYALQTEQEIEDLLISSNDDDDNNNNDQRAASWYRQGLYWRRLGELSVTTKLWKSVLEYYQQKVINNPTTAALQPDPMLGQVLISMAGVDYGRGHYQAAAQRLAEAEPHCVANVNMWVECLQHQGSVYQSMADEHEPPEDSAMTMALEKYQQAIELLEQEQKSMDGSNQISLDEINAEDIENRLLALRMTIADLLGSMEEQPQKLQDARQIYESLLESHCTNTKTDSNTGDTLEASLRYKLGRLLAHQPEHRTIALEHLQRAVALERSLAHSTTTGGVSLTLAHSLNVLGAVHAALAQHATARECFREALLLAQVLAGHEQATHDPLVLQILHNLDTLKQEHRQQQQQQQSDACADPILSHPRESGD